LKNLPGTDSLVDAVFFDLDGTLIDTARDMARVLNRLRQQEGLPPLDYDLIRSEVSRGARALIVLAFADAEGSDNFERLRQRFLDMYLEEIHVETTLFPRMDEILDTLETHQVPWGVVTNKPSWLTLPLMESMRLKDRAATIVCADTAGVSKPDPKPMLDACREVSVAPAQSMYVGDDQRDVVAAHGAGMPCIALRCGYIRRGHNPDDWGAEMVMDTTTELLQWLEQQVKSAA
jgi:phosphoglycolate phosphatase